MTEGWKCPNCGSAHAPWVRTCPALVPYRPPADNPFLPSDRPTWIATTQENLT